ncbi:hypothetical protein BO71DRAFT_443717 [Aspergillus ellipticus CBS 707.79]|uniref:Rad60/SUMO-like domain-containing protein n=1 Tax=Aspergillus ellipticus CBS 707.79 TaxID=1448320 RepID=A0A319DHP2_9EURO|nr:hypothetical protein BO71DRAFT_443717 [Aspergillus ellipticus CBS 707.79]
MRSFFKKPSWASRGDENTDLDFYRHAGQVYNDIIAANKKAHSANMIAKNENSKRRRLSFEQSQGKHSPRFYNNDQVPNHQDQAQNFSSSCSSNMQEQIFMNDCQPTVVSCADTFNIANTTETSMRRCEPLVNAPSAQEGTPTAFPRIMQSDEDKEDGTVRSLRGNSTQTSPEDNVSDEHTLMDNDVVVQILITSKIPNTKPLIVRRKMRQPLKDVRLAWCNRQNLSKQMQGSVFLTWKGKRLFDVTTCRSLRIQTKGGNITSPRDLNFFPADNKELQIHMEAATEEINNSNDKLLIVNNSESPKITDFAKENPSSDKVILSCPGLGDLKLIAVFRSRRQIPAEYDVYLLFDGGRLDPTSTLATYELMNNDLVDVVIKLT